MSGANPLNTSGGMHQRLLDSPVAMRRGLRLPTSSLVYDSLDGAARLAIWVAHWLLLMATFTGRFERPQPLAPQPVTSSELIVDRSRACPP